MFDDLSKGMCGTRHECVVVGRALGLQALGTASHYRLPLNELQLACTTIMCYREERTEL